MACCAALALAGCGEEPGAPLVPRFEVVGAPPLEGRGPSFGAAWADTDGDGLPELFLSGHFKPRQTMLLDWSPETGFVNRAETWFTDPETARSGDQHGATFYDLDGDGDQDLLVPLGARWGTGAWPNQVFVQEDGRMTDRAEELGLAYARARSRTMTMMDVDRDGDLDAFCAALWHKDSPTGLFVQGDGQPRFTRRSDLLGTSLQNCCFVQPTRLSDGTTAIWLHGHPPQLLCEVDGRWVDTAPDRGFQGPSYLRDTTWADLDGDGDLDLIGARGSYGPDLHQPTPSSARFSWTWKEGNLGVRARVTTPVAFELEGMVFDPGGKLPRPLRVDEIRVGAAGTPAEATQFTLDPTNPEHRGLVADGEGVLIGFDEATGELVACVRWPDRVQLLGSLKSDAPLEVELTGISLDHNTKPLAVVLQSDGMFAEAGESLGLTEAFDAISVAAADFDNDMDVDLYVVQNRALRNPPNVYLENRGNRFVAHEHGGGAPGNGTGRGDAVAVADYDGDGFLDLCVTNGEGETPLCNEGVDEIYRGIPNGNHWLLIDLVGTRSNRDAIGAWVEIEAGGRRQVRLRDGGIHRFAQHHKRLHFGLGPHDRVDTVTVTWPSGQVQTLSTQAADQVLRIVEPE